MFIFVGLSKKIFDGSCVNHTNVFYWNEQKESLWQELDVPNPLHKYNKLAFSRDS